MNCNAGNTGLNNQLKMNSLKSSPILRFFDF